MDYRQKIINRIFETQGLDGFWKVIPESDKYFPDYLHYVPNFRASLWVLILLADLKCDRQDSRIKTPLKALQNHFFDPEHGIFTLKEDHFPIPCLNGNMIYLDCYFNGVPGNLSLKALDFFHKYQRFDDGKYEIEPNQFCSNKSCYGKHSCYWGIEKLLKGISFIPKKSRTKEVSALLQRCIDYVLLHRVCFSSKNPKKIMVQKMDLLTFPNMYKSDFLEILWLLKREHIVSEKLKPALTLLKSKQQPNGSWLLERKVNNLITSVGSRNQSNVFVTERANEVLKFYDNLN